MARFLERTGWILAWLVLATLGREACWGAESAGSPTEAMCRVYRLKGNVVDISSGTVVRLPDGNSVVTTTHNQTPGRLQLVFQGHEPIPATHIGQWDEVDLLRPAVPLPRSYDVATPEECPSPGERVCLVGFGSDGQFGFLHTDVKEVSPQGARIDLVMRGSARSGDSGGAVLNANSKLVGVIWGSGDGETRAVSCKSFRFTSGSTCPGSTCGPGGGTPGRNQAGTMISGDFMPYLAPDYTAPPIPAPMSPPGRTPADDLVPVQPEVLGQRPPYPIDPRPSPTVSWDEYVRGNNDNWDRVWKRLAELREQIAQVEGKPGPQGKDGEQGPPGPAGDSIITDQDGDGDVDVDDLVLLLPGIKIQNISVRGLIWDYSDKGTPEQIAAAINHDHPAAKVVPSQVTETLANPRPTGPAISEPIEIKLGGGFKQYHQPVFYPHGN